MEQIDWQAWTIQSVTETISTLRYTLAELQPRREVSLALTKLEEAEMWLERV